MKLKSIFDQTDFVHASGTKEELQVANYLKEQCEALGVPAKLEGFRVAMGEIEEAHFICMQTGWKFHAKLSHAAEAEVSKANSTICREPIRFPLPVQKIKLC